jgi:hypothetical protein
MRTTLFLLSLLVLTPPAADAVNCALACQTQIRKCIKKCCNPPAVGPRKACRVGIRGGAIAACKAAGKQACPKKACIIEDCGPL